MLIRCHALTLTFDLLTMNFYHFGCHVFKLCRKFERNRIIHGWVIDDLAHFRRAILGGGHFLRNVYTQLHQTWRGHRAIIAPLQVCFRVQIPCSVFKRGRLKVEWCWKWLKISHFLTPSPAKIRGEVDEISGSIHEGLSTNEPPEYIWRPSTARLLSAVDW